MVSVCVVPHVHGKLCQIYEVVPQQLFHVHVHDAVRSSHGNNIFSLSFFPPFFCHTSPYVVGYLLFLPLFFPTMCTLLCTLHVSIHTLSRHFASC